MVRREEESLAIGVHCRNLLHRPPPQKDIVSMSGAMAPFAQTQEMLKLMHADVNVADERSNVVILHVHDARAMLQAPTSGLRSISAAASIKQSGRHAGVRVDQQDVIAIRMLPDCPRKALLSSTA